MVLGLSWAFCCSVNILQIHQSNTLLTLSPRKAEKPASPAVTNSRKAEIPASPTVTNSRKVEITGLFIPVKPKYRLGNFETKTATNNVVSGLSLIHI